MSSPASSSPRARVGPYLLLREVGRGGMGVVFEAIHESIGNRVAIKFLHATLGAEAQQRLMAEAQALGRVEHPGLVRVHDCIVSDAGETCLIMEFVAGQPLRAQMGRPLALGRLVRYGRQIAAALAEAHSKGVIHRDLKPENILLIPDREAREGERLKLLDFGIARRLDVAPGPDSGRRAGTTPYMAPEQFISTALTTEKSDVYTLGVLLYELASGRTPFAGTVQQVACNHVYGQAQPIAQLRPTLPPPFCALLERMLSKEARRRPTMREVEVALSEPVSEQARLSVPGTQLAYALGSMALLLSCLCMAYVYHWLRWSAPFHKMRLLPGRTFFMGIGTRESEQTLRWNLENDLRLAGKPISAADQAENEKSIRGLLAREQPQHEVSQTPFLMDVKEVTNQEVGAWLNGLLQQGQICMSYIKEHDGRLDHFQVLEGHPLPDGTCRLDAVYPMLLDNTEHRDYFGLQYNEPARRFHVEPSYADLPAVLITWLGARRYCQTRGLDLPTEKMWELAARGPQQSRFPWGDADPTCESYVYGRSIESTQAHSWRDGFARACIRPGRRAGPMPVGTTPNDRSPYGILDMAGNAAEWTLDAYEDNYASQVRAGTTRAGQSPDEVTALPTGELISHSVRGGAWSDTYESGRGSARSHYPKRRSELRPGETQSQANGDLGFRCAGELEPVVAETRFPQHARWWLRLRFGAEPRRK